jgi:hypothetical protein
VRVFGDKQPVVSYRQAIERRLDAPVDDDIEDERE